ncbi:MAG: helix-turn-helix transcriptional regulator [Solobacterium sp.]|nr:helix-turn-helix transcriptional regulator [Solobacterium sp.]
MRKEAVHTSMSVGERLLEIVRQQGMTQKQFSVLTGIPQSTISDWRSKRLNPAADKILIICDVLGISPYDLLSGTEDRYAAPEKLLVDKNSDEYVFCMALRKLSEKQKQRVYGYIQALAEAEKSGE